MNFRQGDIIVRKTDLTIHGEPLTDRVLARGESSGHAHRISSGNAELYKFDRRLFLRVSSERAVVTHEEHAPITIPSGLFEVLNQREYEPEGWKTVGD